MKEELEQCTPGMNLPPGTLVFFWSLTKEKWIGATVIKEEKMYARAVGNIYFLHHADGCCAKQINALWIPKNKTNAV